MKEEIENISTVDLIKMQKWINKKQYEDFDLQYGFENKQVEKEYKELQALSDNIGNIVLMRIKNLIVVEDFNF